MTDDPVRGEGPHAFPGVSLALFDEDDGCRLQLHARPDGPRDGVDPISELAVFAGVSGLTRMMMVVPVRMRDLTDDLVVSRSALVTRVRRLPDGRIELEAFSLGTAVAGDEAPARAPAQPVDPALSPVGSLLCDVLATTDLSLRLEEVAAVLESWGHVVLADPALPAVEHARLGRARHRVRRQADELARRHRPMALGHDARRPAAPANLPPGFLPACPL